MSLTTYPGKVFLFTKDPAALLAANYDRVRIERRKAPDADWVEVTTESTRLVVRDGQYNYYYREEKTLPAWEYRPVLMSSAALAADTVFAAVKAVDVSFESILTVQELKDRYLYGLQDALSDDAGIPIPDAVYVHYIKTGITKFETKTRLRLLPQKFVDLHDFFEDDFRAHMSFHLDEYPVLSIEELKLTLPSGQVTTYDLADIKLDAASGQAHVMPRSGISGTWFGLGPAFAAEMRRAKFIPQLFEITYFAGFALGTVPSNIVDIIGKEASSGPLNLAGDLLGGAGIASQTISLDGLSTTFNTTSSSTSAGFGARLIQYNKELKEAYPDVVRFYKGVSITSA